MNCQRCGLALQPGARVCPRCGTPVVQRQQNPYGQRPQGNPYGQQQYNNPYGQQQYNNPYGQRQQNPYGQQPYGQQYNNQYGYPYNQRSGGVHFGPITRNNIIALVGVFLTFIAMFLPAVTIKEKSDSYSESATMIEYMNDEHDVTILTVLVFMAMIAVIVLTVLRMEKFSLIGSGYMAVHALIMLIYYLGDYGDIKDYSRYVSFYLNFGFYLFVLGTAACIFAVFWKGPVNGNGNRSYYRRPPY